MYAVLLEITLFWGLQAVVSKAGGALARLLFKHRPTATSDMLATCAATTARGLIGCGLKSRLLKIRDAGDWRDNPNLDKIEVDHAIDDGQVVMVYSGVRCFVGHGGWLKQWLTDQVWRPDATLAADLHSRFQTRLSQLNSGDILAGLRGRNDSNDDSDGAQESDDEASDGDDDGAADAAAEAEIVAQVKAEPRSGKIYYSMQAALEAGVIFEAGDIVQASCWVEAIIDKPDMVPVSAGDGAAPFLPADLPDFAGADVRPGAVEVNGNSVVVVGDLPPRAGGGLREALLSAGISERLLPLLDLTLEYAQSGASAAGEGAASLAPPLPGGAGSTAGLLALDSNAGASGSAGPAAVPSIAELAAAAIELKQLLSGAAPLTSDVQLMQQVNAAADVIARFAQGGPLQHSGFTVPPPLLEMKSIDDSWWTSKYITPRPEAVHQRGGGRPALDAEAFRVLCVEPGKELVGLPSGRIGGEDRLTTLDIFLRGFEGGIVAVRGPDAWLLTAGTLVQQGAVKAGIFVRDCIPLSIMTPLTDGACAFNAAANAAAQHDAAAVPEPLEEVLLRTAPGLPRATYMQLEQRSWEQRVWTGLYPVAGRVLLSAALLMGVDFRHIRLVDNRQYTKTFASGSPAERRAALERVLLGWLRDAQRSQGAAGGAAAAAPLVDDAELRARAARFASAALSSGLWQEAGIYTKFMLGRTSWAVNGHECDNSENEAQRTAEWRAKNTYRGEVSVPAVRALDDLKEQLEAAGFNAKLSGLNPLADSKPSADRLREWLTTFEAEIATQLPLTADGALAALETIKSGGMTTLTVYNKIKTIMGGGGFGHTPKRRKL